MQGEIRGRLAVEPPEIALPEDSRNQEGRQRHFYGEGCGELKDPPECSLGIECLSTRAAPAARRRDPGNCEGVQETIVFKTRSARGRCDTLGMPRGSTVPPIR